MGFFFIGTLAAAAVGCTIILMGFLIGILVAVAVGWFMLYKKTRFHQGDEKMDSASLSPSPPSSSLSPPSPPSSSPEPSSLSPSSIISSSPPPSSLSPSSPPSSLSSSPPPSSLSSSSSSSSWSLSSPSSSLSPSSSPSSLPHINARSPSSQDFTHQVFPSFHGTDVRKGFLSHTLKEFKSKGINPFIDNNIERSKSIGPELKAAIRGSRIAIVLLSRNYASSSWCLDELVEIMKCREVLGQTVMTVFYEVDPTDVKKQTGEFGRAFKNTCVGRKKEDIERWRQALAEVATIAGEHSSKWEDEAAMIEKITTDISNKLNYSTPSIDFNNLVGMREHMEKLEPLLCLGSSEARMIGIIGPSGIGKTTIAKYLFNQISGGFQHRVFMENIKAPTYTRPCSDDYTAKLYLQQQFMSQIFQKDVKIPHLGVAQERLKDKKVLIVLDDVDRSMQLDAMAYEPRWFGRGSRIIITTQDKKVLKAHKIDNIYKVDIPPPREALQIFCQYAFSQSSPYEGFEKLARKSTTLAGELPLGLRVMGSYFRGMSKQDWKKALPRLRSRLDGQLASILKLSYDALDMEDKDLFLYIACFFNNESIAKVDEYLAKEFLDVRSGLDVLAGKSLISMNNSGFIDMNKLLEQLGRDIVRQESIREPGQRQFLVDARNICEVLTDYTGSRNVQGINFDLSKLSEDLTISERAFEGLSNLKFLRFHYSIGNRRNQLHLPRGLNNISPKLRILHWDQFPGTCLPSNFNAEFLVELNMHGSKLEKLWDEIKPLGNLKWINLSYSVNLKELPDLSFATNLEEMDLSQCTSLVELPCFIGNAINLKKLDLVHCSSLVTLPSSIGNNTNLQNLDLSNCLSLEELPSSIGNLINLEKVNLSHCSSLVKLTDSMGTLINVKELDLRHCSSLIGLAPSIGNLFNLERLDLSHCSSLVELPSSIGNATKVLHLNLKGCSSLKELPSSIGHATHLQKLYLNNCSSLVKLPSSIGNNSNIAKLDLSNCSSLVELPSSIGNATNLLYLSLIGCSRLVKLPFSIGNLTNLKILYLNNCSNLEEVHSSIGNAVSLEKLDLSNCSSLVKLPFSIGNATNLRKLKLDNCSSLVELPSSIGNLCKLQQLSLKGCSKLEILPININIKSLNELDLTDCSLLKSFPQISTYIGVLRLKGTSIEEVPSSMRLWNRLTKFQMSYCERLKIFPHALSCITELHLSNTEIQEVSPWIKEISNLRRFVLDGCRKVVSLPQLSDSLSSLHAPNCGSLERLDCSFHNPQIRLNFANCFRLNKEAIALILHTSTRRNAVFPGGEVPAYFTYRTTGSSLIVKLNERPLPISLRFKACILPISKADDDTSDDDESLMLVYVRIMEKQNGLTVPSTPRDHNLPPPLTKHLYTFEIEAKVTSTELLFEFCVHRENWEIGECGVFELMEVPRVHEHDVSSDSDIGGKH